MDQLQFFGETGNENDVVIISTRRIHDLRIKIRWRSVVCTVYLEKKLREMGIFEQLTSTLRSKRKEQFT
jgi:hypothetical protein